MYCRGVPSPQVLAGSFRNRSLNRAGTTVSMAASLRQMFGSIAAVLSLPCTWLCVKLAAGGGKRATNAISAGDAWDRKDLT